MNNKLDVSPKYYSALAQVFSPLVLDSLIDRRESACLREVLKISGITDEIRGMTFVDFFNAAYETIADSYRNEYVYKNAIVNKVLLGKHSLNTSYMLSEFRVGSCKADVVILNGTSTVYEIKSEFDSLDRLQNQVFSYTEVFDKVNVITSESQISRVDSLLPKSIGVLELTPAYTIKTIREAASGRENVNQGTIFSCLRQTEYLKIIRKLFNEIPDVPNTSIYKECQRIFCKLSPLQAHDEMVKTLCLRPERKILKEFILDIPGPLRAYFLSREVDRAKTTKLINLLSERVDSILGAEMSDRRENVLPIF